MSRRAAPASEVVRAAYDQWASQYDGDLNRTRDLNVSTFREAGLPIDGARVFEAGCGTGLITAQLAARARSIVALDFSAGMLDKARARALGDHVRFVQGDILKPWPAAAESQDVVVITLVLEHVASVEPVFREARRVLDSRGMFYVCELHPDRQLMGRQARFTPEGSQGECRVPAWMHTLKAFRTSAESAGFVVERMTDHGDERDETPRLLQLRLRAC